MWNTIKIFLLSFIFSNLAVQPPLAAIIKLCHNSLNQSSSLSATFLECQPFLTRLDLLVGKRSIDWFPVLLEFLKYRFIPAGNICTGASVSSSPGYVKSQARFDSIQIQLKYSWHTTEPIMYSSSTVIFLFSFAFYFAFSEE